MALISEVTGMSRSAMATVPALHDFTITVDEGEIVTLLGANGAGKTTTLRMISGLHHASLGDRPLRWQSTSRAAPPTRSSSSGSATCPRDGASSRR